MLEYSINLTKIWFRGLEIQSPEGRRNYTIVLAHKLHNYANKHCLDCDKQHHRRYSEDIAAKISPGF